MCNRVSAYTIFTNSAWWWSHIFLSQRVPLFTFWRTKKRQLGVSKGPWGSLICTCETRGVVVLWKLSLAVCKQYLWLLPQEIGYNESALPMFRLPTSPQRIPSPPPRSTYRLLMMLFIHQSWFYSSISPTYRYSLCVCLSVCLSFSVHLCELSEMIVRWSEVNGNSAVTKHCWSLVLWRNEACGQEKNPVLCLWQDKGFHVFYCSATSIKSHSVRIILVWIYSFVLYTLGLGFHTKFGLYTVKLRFCIEHSALELVSASWYYVLYIMNIQWVFPGSVTMAQTRPRKHSIKVSTWALCWWLSLPSNFTVVRFVSRYPVMLHSDQIGSAAIPTLDCNCSGRPGWVGGWEERERRFTSSCLASGVYRGVSGYVSGV